MYILAVADEVGHGVSHSQCLHRWFNSTNPSIKKGRWSEQEDEVADSIQLYSGIPQPVEGGVPISG